jgi:hypothetical protein
MERSESVKEIATALCLFQGAVEKIKKSTTNPFFKSKYASLSDILDVIRQPLSENGLSFVQFPKGKYELTTMLMHISGEWLAETYEMQPTKHDPQGAGSVITYQRRYALGAILGLNIDVDDDANKASEPVKKPEPQPDKKQEPQQDTRERLTPKHKNWEKVIAYLKSAEGTMTEVLKKYTMDHETEVLLIDKTLE